MGAHQLRDLSRGLPGLRRVFVVGRGPFQRAEQGHRGDPAPHAIGGDAVVAAVAADELLEDGS